MRYLLSIDPGPEKCGAVVIHEESKEVLYAGEPSVLDVMTWVRTRAVRSPGVCIGINNVVCEDIVSMGLAVGKSVFSTCKVIGRIQEACHSWGHVVNLVSRKDVKIVLAGGSTYKDPDTGARRSIGDTAISNIVKSRYPETGGGKHPVVGTKKEPGPLYAVKGHAWQALAVALVYCEIRQK